MVNEKSKFCGYEVTSDIPNIPEEEEFYMYNNENNSLQYNSFASPEVTKFLELLEHPKVQSFLKLFFENSLVTSEMKVLKRLGDIERVLGLNDMEEEGIPTIPERIDDLEEKIENGTPIVSPSIEKEPTTKTEMRAVHLVKELEASGKDHFTANEIIDFLKCKLPDSCKIDDTVKNIRKVKQDVIKAAKEMFTNVDLSKKKTGHREVRLILLS